MNNIYEQIRKACILANPSIFDLKMGCEIDTRFFGRKILPMGAVKTEKSFIKLEDGRILDVIEILGRPITLQDVLFTLGKKFFIQGDGYIYDEALSGGQIKFDLTKSVQEQSLEVLEFLAKLLTK